MARLRTFIAVDIGKSIRGRAVSLQDTLARSAPEVKWVEPENLHVTLLFLGEVDERVLADVCRLVQAATAEQPAFPLTVETVGCFPNARRLSMYFRVSSRAICDPPTAEAAVTSLSSAKVCMM